MAKELGFEPLSLYERQWARYRELYPDVEAISVSLTRHETPVFS